MISLRTRVSRLLRGAVPAVLAVFLLVCFAGAAQAGGPPTADPKAAPAAAAKASKAQFEPLVSASARAMNTLEKKLADAAGKKIAADPKSPLSQAADSYNARAAAAKSSDDANTAASIARTRRAKANSDVVAAVTADAAAKKRAAADLQDAEKALQASEKNAQEQLDAYEKATRACNAAVRAYLEGELGACTGDCAKASASICSGDQGALKASAPGAPSGAAAAAIGGVAWQGAVVTGLADFLSQRADQELVLWLSTQISEKLCAKPSDAEASKVPAKLLPRDLFPGTCALMVDGDAPATPESGSLLAAALREDFQLLPARVAAHAVKVDVEVLVVLQATLTKMSEGVAPLEALAGLGKNKTLERECAGGTDPTKALACGLQLIGMATRLAADATHGPVSPEDVASFVVELKGACGAACAGAVIDAESAGAFLGAVGRFAEAVKAQRDRTGGSAPERAAVMIAATLDLLDAAIGFFPETAEPRKAWALIEPALRSATFFLRGDYSDGLHALSATLRAMEGVSDKAAWKDFVRLSSMVADIAGAKDSKQVQSALEAAAAPVGTWREKRRGPMLSATGLVGVSFGAEVPENNGGGRRSAYAALAPVGMVGLDLSFPVGSSSTTLGLFFSALDVGQLVTLPLQSPEGKTTNGTKEVPSTNKDVTLSQVLSPGAFLKVGLGNSPLVLGAGFSYAPDLRSYLVRNAETDKEIDRGVFSMMRFHAFLAVDVTILPILR